jgi:hypothetical protein
VSVSQVTVYVADVLPASLVWIVYALAVEVDAVRPVTVSVHVAPEGFVTLDHKSLSNIANKSPTSV